MADKGTASTCSNHSEQETELETANSSPRGVSKDTALRSESLRRLMDARAASKKSAADAPPPRIGQGPPGHWMDLARSGYFEQPPKSKLTQMTESISQSITSFTDSFKKKIVRSYWGQAPVRRKEWYYLKGEQRLPLGPNRWEPFEPEVQNMLSTAAELQCSFRGLTLFADVEDEEHQQVWQGSRLGYSVELMGLPAGMWEPKGDEQPDSLLLQAGKGIAWSGHFMTLAKERELVEEFYNARGQSWTREETPFVTAVLLVEETIESAVEIRSPEILANPEYVVRVFAPNGNAVIGWKKDELQDRSARDLKMRYDQIWPRGSGNPFFVVFGQEIGADDDLKRLLKRAKPNPLDIKVLTLNERQTKMKEEGIGTIMDGRFVDLNLEGHFNWGYHNHPRTPAEQPCCVVS